MITPTDGVCALKMICVFIFYAILINVQTERSYWAGWAQFLHRWKLEHAACFVLDAAGPLSVLLAQMVYLGQPLFSGANSQQKWISLAQLLENPEESRSFAALLRQEEPL